MKYDDKLDELENLVDRLSKKVDQLLDKSEIWGKRLSNVENYVVRKRHEERKKRELEEEIWTKSTK